MAIEINEGLRTQTINVLTRNTYVTKINFARLPFKFWPDAYLVRFPKLVSEENIGFNYSGDIPPGAGASYSRDIQQFNFRSEFSFTNLSHQALLIHEITHCLVMSYELGQIKAVEDECCGYIAEAIYAKQVLGTDLGGKTSTMQAIRTKAFAIAGNILNGGYLIPDTDWNELKALIIKDPIYVDIGQIESRGIKWKAKF